MDGKTSDQMYADQMEDAAVCLSYDIRDLKEELEREREITARQREAINEVMSSLQDLFKQLPKILSGI